MSAWNQVSSGFQKLSEYFNWSQQCCGLDSLDSFSDFQPLKSFLQAFVDRHKSSIYNWYHHQLEIKDKNETIEATILMKSIRIHRRLLETCFDFFA